MTATFWSSWVKYLSIGWKSGCTHEWFKPSWRVKFKTSQTRVLSSFNSTLGLISSSTTKCIAPKLCKKSRKRLPSPHKFASTHADSFAIFALLDDINRSNLGTPPAVKIEKASSVVPDAMLIKIQIASSWIVKLKSEKKLTARWSLDEKANAPRRLKKIDENWNQSSIHHGSDRRIDSQESNANLMECLNLCRFAVLAKHLSYWKPELFGHWARFLMSFCVRRFNLLWWFLRLIWRRKVFLFFFLLFTGLVDLSRVERFSLRSVETSARGKFLHVSRGEISLFFAHLQRAALWHKSVISAFRLHLMAALRIVSRDPP